MTATFRSDSTGESSVSSAYEDRTEELTVGLIFEVLKERHRRYVLYYLADRPEPVTFADLVDTVAEWVVESATAADRRRVAASLHHTHLPKLEGMGFVEYDRDDDHIASTGKAISTAPYLRFAADYEFVGD